MLPSSGVHSLFTFDPELTNSQSTEKSLQEGVKQVTDIYNDFEKVGTSDRSLIWNS